MVRTIEACLDCRGVELNASRENVVINPPPSLFLPLSKDCVIARVPWRGRVIVERICLI